MSLEQLLDQAKLLALPERARLAELLLQSLDEASSGEVDALWGQVAMERDADMDANPGSALNAREELQRLMLRYEA